MRLVRHGADEERPPPELNFFQMQGDLYVRFQADDRFSAYLDRGQSATYELFGLAYVLPSLRASGPPGLRLSNGSTQKPLACKSSSMASI